ncbi:hypothetical protein K501DRAFT_197201, partial [Backusella circina FSU 941]
LTDEHIQFLTEYFDENLQGYILEAVEELTKKIDNLDMKKTKFNEFMINGCNLSFKKVTFWPETRQKEDTIKERLKVLL